MKQYFGFTIVEIIVVITAIAILAGIGMVSYSATQVRARDTERTADIDVMSAALETYYERFGKYPDTATIAGTGFITDTLRVPTDAMTTPGSTATAPYYSYSIGTSATTSQYAYMAYQNTGSTQCTAATQTCTRFVLYYNLERSGAQTKLSKFGN
ncbi:hypothetical protein GII36_01280 [Candidatus Mycosynbacter amalyticus]|uniref:Prepilin-type N-terminal cleavage/methylation domain-containing protein n=1 Tax=Candidatus Mycosynbacter amalyticus TaxID=2665156 RepID=A0A857MMH8_9BACT|nr:hypothetical protein [Candidatus Mycosynbacter amalyticus]QHN42479.1 hypothetical protein GII36_01280 [Candidatus Mycosynbacter amalyticus]